MAGAGLSSATVPGPRIPPLRPDERDPRTAEMLDALRPPGATELNIFATLARHPRLFRRWSAFGGVLLYGGELSPRDRELLILRTGFNCRSDYEWGQHVAIAREAGLADDEIADVAAGPDAERWTPLERTLLIAADELHESARISDGTWSALAAAYNEQQLIEVCMIVGQYHLVAFTLNSLGVEREPGVEGLPS